MQTKLTPLMQQYWDIKNQHTDKILLFRMGDFFEMFHDDAEKAAPILNIALTQRNKKSGDGTKMCGVPHHSIATPIAKLLQAGLKVAMCDQIEDPAVAKGIVKRAVTRVLTPGMVYDPDTLDQLKANYLSAYDEERLAFVDVTTGESFFYECSSESEREELLSLLAPVELVLSPKQSIDRARKEFAFKTVQSTFDSGLNSARERTEAYIVKTQGQETLKALRPFEKRQRQTQLRISAQTLRHLEVFETAKGEREGSFFWAIDRTKTSAGARLLKSWLLNPLRDLSELQRRQSEIQLWLGPTAQLKTFRQQMSEVGDLERRLGKVHASTFNARDLAAISQSILAGEKLIALYPKPTQLEGLESSLKLARQIEATLNEELPIATKEGGLIKKGVIAELDELIELTQSSQKLLADLETREKQNTGISSLKVRYNNVFGFYIELTKTHAHKAPDHYRRKQTLTNAERFTTDELDKLEEKVLSARSKRDQLEYEIFMDLRKQVIDTTGDLLALVREWTRWDVLSAFAWLALERKYVCPVFNNQGQLEVTLGRHPVVEQSLKSGFVPNSVHLTGGECMLLTGPNMAGKSTLMRQVALIVLLAQIGCYVPAESANLPLFEQIFTRLGASDALNEGLSTFMVEMTETAQILKNTTKNSLVVIDEIGRGTSTYDGMSLAQAILEHLVTQKQPYLLFATHYHELTSLSQIFPQIHNAHMSVQDKNGQIQFLHTLAKGPANRSYGIHVGKLAGLPATVTQRAQQILGGFENQGGGMQLSLTEMPQAEPQTSSWPEEIKNLNLTHMTPMEALNKLFEWQREASS